MGRPAGHSITFLLLIPISCQHRCRRLYWMNEPAAVRDTSPEARRELRIDVVSERLPLWIVRLEALLAHRRVLRRVDRAVILAYKRIEFVEEAQRFGTVIGEVQRQREARTREREHAGRRDGTKLFEHDQERTLLCATDTLQDLLHHFVAILKRDDALVLEEATLAIDAIPVIDRVERVEERVIRLYFMYDIPQLSTVVDLVEGPHGQ